MKKIYLNIVPLLLALCLPFVPIRAQAGMKEMMAAIDSGDVAKVKERLQIEDKSILEEIDPVSKESPFKRAVNKGVIGIVSELADKVDVNASDEEGKNALFWAIEKGGDKKKDVVELLINKGLPIDKQNGWKNTPLLKAIQTDNKELALLLIEKGADLTIGNQWESTPIIWAARKGMKEVVLKILEKKGEVADPNMINGQNIWKTTALMWAARTGNIAITEALVKAGADPSLTNVLSKTAKDLALLYGNKALIKYLDPAADASATTAVGTGSNDTSSASRTANGSKEAVCPAKSVETISSLPALKLKQEVDDVMSPLLPQNAQDLGWSRENQEWFNQRFVGATPGKTVGPDGKVLSSMKAIKGGLPYITNEQMDHLKARMGKLEEEAAKHGGGKAKAKWEDFKRLFYDKDNTNALKVSAHIEQFLSAVEEENEQGNLYVTPVLDVIGKLAYKDFKSFLEQEPGAQTWKRPFEGQGKTLVVPVYTEGEDAGKGFSHYTLARVDVEKKQIEFFDSDGATTKPEDYHFILDILKRIGDIQNVKGVKDVAGATWKNGWKITRVEGSLQQRPGSADCGPSTCAMASKIILDPSMPLQTENLPYQRLVMLYKLMEKDGELLPPPASSK